MLTINSKEALYDSLYKAPNDQKDKAYFTLTTCHSTLQEIQQKPCVTYYY